MIFDERGLPVQPVWCYRDSRSAQGVEMVKEKMEWPMVFAETGIQFMSLNTLYQVATESVERLAKGRQILLLGDAINFFCSGVRATKSPWPAPRRCTIPRSGAGPKNCLRR